MAAKSKGKPAKLAKSLMNDFPLLLPLDVEKRKYNGYITVLNRNYRIMIELPSEGDLEKAKISCGWRLRHILQGYENVVKQRLKQSPDLTSFLDELQNIVEKLVDCSQSEGGSAPPRFYSQLIDEIDKIGWRNLVYVDATFTMLKLSARDTSNREHILTVQITSQYPSHAPNCSTDLPAPFVCQWTQDSSLRGVYDQFKQLLGNFTDFWDMMDEIDANTWVLEPDHPSRSSKTRRIALGNNASIQVEVNPHQPRHFPECRFLGSDKVTSPLREKLGSNYHLWSEKQSVLVNLQNILQCTFPSPRTTKKEEVSVECGICYSYKLEGLIPDKACDDPRCGQPFHSSCLHEWLRALPSSRQSFNVIFGECPYCGKPIALKV